MLSARVFDCNRSSFSLGQKVSGPPGLPDSLAFPGEQRGGKGGLELEDSVAFHRSHYENTTTHH